MPNRHASSNSALLIATFAVLLWFPVFAFAADAVGYTDSPLTKNAIYYKNEYITLLCSITMVIGAILATQIEPPADLQLKLQIKARWARFLFGIMGGLVAYLYTLDRNNALISLHPVYVFGVALVFPLALQIAYPFLLGAYYRVLKAWGALKGDTEHDRN